MTKIVEKVNALVDEAAGAGQTELPHASTNVVVLGNAPSVVQAAPRAPPVLLPFVANVGDEIHGFMVSDITKSGLKLEDVPAWYAVRSEGIGRYTRMPGATPSGYAIPYFGLDGKPIQDNGTDFVRFRLQAPLAQEIKNGVIKGSGKYVSAKGASFYIYIPRGLARILSGEPEDLPLVIVEGEKKAEALVKAGLPAVAISGIYMWFDPDADRKDTLESRPAHPMLLDVINEYTAWVDGAPTLVVLFDSDGAPITSGSTQGLVKVEIGRKTYNVLNPDVFRAARTAANALYRAMSMNLNTCAAYCPMGVGGAKMGADDWLVAAGAPAVSSAIIGMASTPLCRRLNSNGKASYLLQQNESDDMTHMEDHLLQHDDFYVFGERAALIERDADGAADLRIIESPVNLARTISEVVQTFERDQQSGAMRKAYVPTRLAEGLFKQNWSLAHGARIVDAVAAHPVPVIRDGVVTLSAEGYDDTTRIFGAYSAKDWDVPVEPTAQDFVQARDDLADLIDEVYMQSPADLAAALAAIFTAVCRSGLPTAPGFLVSAPMSGAGKGYFASMLTTLATDLRIGVDKVNLNTRGQGAEAEFSKMALGVLSNRRPVLQFDEVVDDKVDGVGFRTLLSEETFSGRLLGANAMAALPTRKLVLITANNVDPTMDSVRRIITVRLNPPADDSKRRQSADNGGLNLLKADRARYVRAAIVAVLWCTNSLRLLGTPNAMPVGMSVLKGYVDWSRTCAAPAMLTTWAMIGSGAQPINLVETERLEAIAAMRPDQVYAEDIDPTLRQRETMKSDPARMAVRDLLEALHRFQAAKTTGTWTAADIMKELQIQRHLSERYERDYGTDITPDQFVVYQELLASGLRADQMSNSTKLGKALASKIDNEVGGYVLKKAGTDGNNKTLWVVRKVR
jgi:hypothetical protein